MHGAGVVCSNALGRGDRLKGALGSWGDGHIAPCPLDFGEGVHRGALLLLKELDVPHE